MEDALRDGFPVLEEGQGVYLELFTHGDDSCPGDTHQIAIGNLTGCTSESGYYYSGTSTYEDEVSENDERLKHQRIVHGDFLLRDDTGQALHVGGHIKRYRTEWWETGATRVEIDYEGSWLWEGDDLWLDQTLSGKLQARLDQDEEQSLYLDGALGFYETYWFFEELQISSGQDCDWSASGAVSLRDPSGGWSRIELSEDCGLCTAAIFESTQSLGEVCLPADLLMSSAPDWLKGVE
jgi:hypothetical protein